MFEINFSDMGFDLFIRTFLSEFLSPYFSFGFRDPNGALESFFFNTLIDICPYEIGFSENGKKKRGKKSFLCDVKWIWEHSGA